MAQPPDPPRNRPPAATLVRRWSVLVIALAVAVVLLVSAHDPTSRSKATPRPATRPHAVSAPDSPPAACLSTLRPLAGMPPAPDPCNVYSADSPANLSPTARLARPLVYVPNSLSDSVSEIDPATYTVVRTFSVGRLPQHVVVSWDEKTLWVTNDQGNSLTPIDPATGVAGPPVHVPDPYNMYFTPDGRFAIVVAEALRRLEFLDPHTMAVVNSLPVPCRGVNHMDFSANGTVLVASCEFSGQLIEVDVARQAVLATLTLPAGSEPQDVKVSPDGTLFYVADLRADGVWQVDAATFQTVGFIPTGKGAHGLFISRSTKDLYVSNRGSGTISVIEFATGRVVDTWTLPRETAHSLGPSGSTASPDMGGLSADGTVLWLSGRFDADVYAVDTRTGSLLARVPVGGGPHGVLVWPQPGTYSLGHTGVMR